MKRSLALPVVASAAAALVLTGCSSAHDSSHSDHASATSSVQAGGPHNSADVTFATDMVPHHRQAVVMADLALSTSKNAAVLAVAREIKSEQGPEITAMTGWLTAWREPVPVASDHGMSGMDGMDGTGGHSMPGMMTSESMAALGKATGTAFDRLFLTMMVEHHRGAVTMARTEQVQGRNPDATTLAASIVTTQTTEITTMTTLASTL